MNSCATSNALSSSPYSNVRVCIPFAVSTSTGSCYASPTLAIATCLELALPITSPISIHVLLAV